MLFELFAFCASILLVIFVFNRYSRKKCTAPGPPHGLPILGNLLQVFDKQVFLKLCDWQKEFGDVYKLNLFTEEVVVVNGDAIYDVLVTSGDDYGGRVQAARSKMYSNDFRSITFRQPDKEWKAMRRIAQKCLKQYGEGVANIERISMEEIRECLDKFDKTEAFDPYHAINDMVIGIIIIISTGLKLSADDPLHQKIKRAEKLFPFAFGVDTSYLDVVPWLRNLPNKATKVFNDAMDAARQMESEIFQRSTSNVEKSGIAGVFDAINSNGESLDKSFLKGMSNDITIGGTMTTTTQIKSMIALTVDYPKVQQKLQDEIETVLGQRLPTYEDRRSMPYMEAFMLEGLRYMSEAALAVPHETLKDVTLRGNFIPKGTQIWPNLYGLHHDERFFPDPYTFKPERFLDSKGELIPADERKFFMPFGGGKRVCIGEQLAKIRMFLFMTTLLQRYTLCPERDGCPPNYDSRKSVLGLVMQMHPYKIKTIKR
ncbi:unnamed protein product [Owenia fusiformis]|uniref:Uncharacterized protein n=1 Tax=Owenia fusiformis TaxID=6347 RepID=A0A8J1XNY0_OWEFU|nr:unnamed protein product [Owenia fusiformis]